MIVTASVESRSRPGLFHNVRIDTDDGTGDCTCEAYMLGGYYCDHMRLVANTDGLEGILETMVTKLTVLKEEMK